MSRPSGAVLLDVLRDDLGLTGTKDACREGDCGSCLVLLGTPGSKGASYQAVNSCLFPVGEAAGRHVVTIEGLARADLGPAQRALVDEGAIQCGFCTPGLVIALTSFLLNGAALSESEAVSALGGNICRCTGHVAVRRAAVRLAAQFRDLESFPAASPRRIAALVARGVLPPYFLGVPRHLRALADSPPKPSSQNPAASKTTLVAGGTDLYVTQADRLRDEAPVLLSRREDLRGVRVENRLVRIGAATPLSEIEASPLLGRMIPDLVSLFARVASPPIRCRATVAGNIVNASPAGDLSIMFLALNAALVLVRGRRRRTIPLRDFFKGYKELDLRPGEMIAEIRFPVLGTGDRFHFEKVARRERLDIAGAASAVRLRLRGGRIVEAFASAGSVAPVPLFLRKTSAWLTGRAVSADTARGAAAVAAGEIAPISDVRGSAEYKRALLPRLILAHFLTLFPDLVREEDLA